MRDRLAHQYFGINEKLWLSSDLCDNRANGEHLEKIDYGLSTRFIT
jgi:hypothetical protein